jgi:hypothetical protein
MSCRISYLRYRRYLSCYCLAWYRFLTVHQCCESESVIRCFFYHWTRILGKFFLGPGAWISDPRTRILDFGSQIPDPSHKSSESFNIFRG